jgi:hypothetical protein
VVQVLRKEDIGEDNDVDRDCTENEGSWQLPAEREEEAVGLSLLESVGTDAAGTGKDGVIVGAVELKEIV